MENERRIRRRSLKVERRETGRRIRRGSRK